MNHYASVAHSRNEEKPWEDHHANRVNKSVTTIIMGIVIAIFVFPVVFYFTVKTVRFIKNRRQRVPDEEEGVELETRPAVRPPGV